jgi:hypothetical protein
MYQSAKEDVLMLDRILEDVTSKRKLRIFKSFDSLLRQTGDLALARRYRRVAVIKGLARQVNRTSVRPSGLEWNRNEVFKLRQMPKEKAKDFLLNK